MKSVTITEQDVRRWKSEIEDRHVRITVGRFKITCKNCNQSRVWKVMRGRWSGLPADVD